MSSEFARRQMVEQQVRTWDVSDPAVLGLLSTMSRDQFVDEQFAGLAYADTEIPLGHGEKMMKPIVEGRLLQALEIEPQHSILEIGTGSGYLTACLARLGSVVTSIDIHDVFLQLAADRLSHANIENVKLSRMDANVTLPDGKFDAIAVTGSIPVFDQRYFEALNPGGRLFVVVGQSPVMNAQLVKHGEAAEMEVSTLFETDIAPLLNCTRTSAFNF